MSRLGKRKRADDRLALALWISILLLIAAGFLAAPCRVWAQEEETGRSFEEFKHSLSTNRLAQEIRDHFKLTFKAFFYGILQRPVTGLQNPNNDFLAIPRDSVNFDLRPDISFNYWRLEALVKPRMNMVWQHWDEGRRTGDSNNSRDDWFANEYLARVKFFNDLYLSYGRENLQWGPAFFISPSNPFFRDNGQSNPKQEVPGMDFARAVWVPTSNWTLSLIENIDDGRQFFLNGFERTNAFKLDYTSIRKYASLIVSHREGDRTRLGGFAGSTVTDAILFYTEASFAEGSNALYPVRDRSALRISMQPIKEDDSSIEALFLVGGSYTFEAGPSVALEYVYNSEGYDDEEAELFDDLKQEAAQHFVAKDPLANLSRGTMRQTLDPNLRLLRQNYLMLQYAHPQIRNVMNLTMRYVFNIDDGSSQFIPIVEYDISDHFQLFLVGAHTFGENVFGVNNGFSPNETDFRRIIDYRWMVGVEYTF